MFDMRCEENGIEHRFTKINRLWTNGGGQAERMNRTTKEATSSATITIATNSSGKTSMTSSPAYNFRPQAQDTQGPHPMRNADARAKTININPLQKMPGLNS